jgi:hypothetical protein
LVFSSGFADTATFEYSALLCNSDPYLELNTPHTTFESAPLIANSFSGLTLCVGDTSDYYKVNMSNHQRLGVTVTYNQQVGVLALEIYDQNKNLVRVSATSSGTEV